MLGIDVLPNVFELDHETVSLGTGQPIASRVSGVSRVVVELRLIHLARLFVREDDLSLITAPEQCSEVKVRTNS
jgi:hypothetical protein